MAMKPRAMKKKTPMRGGVVKTGHIDMRKGGIFYK